MANLSSLQKKLNTLQERGDIEKKPNVFDDINRVREKVAYAKSISIPAPFKIPNITWYEIKQDKIRYNSF